MTHVLPDQSPPKGRERTPKERRPVNPEPQTKRRSKGNYERWRAGWVRELLRGKK